MADTSEVVIVGGGAAGCAVAYYLAEAGIKSTVVEREGIAAMASGFSAGGLNPLEGAGIPGPLAPLAMESFRLHRQIWDELIDQTGIDFNPKVISALRVAFENREVDELQKTHRIFDSAGDGFRARWLDAEQLREIEPGIASGSVRALEIYGNAKLSSFRYTMALAQTAERLGAVSRSGELAGVNTTGDRVRSVMLRDAEIECEHVVFATGPWSGQLEDWLGVRVPVEPLKGEILRMRTPSVLPPGPDVQGAGVSLYSRDDQVWIGSTEERKGFDTKPSTSARDRLMAGAQRLMPAMADAELVLHTACLRPVTPDWLPIIGRAPGWDNVYLATGAGRKGILISPGMGKALADLISTGTTDLPVGGFAPDRFAG